MLDASAPAERPARRPAPAAARELRLACDGARRRRLLRHLLARVAASAVVALSLPSCARPPRGEPGNPRLVVLGFDGADPREVRKGFAAGRLAALAALAARGSFRDLAITTPPQSPVAWASFATGLDPAQHGVLGLVERDPATYLPRPAAIAMQPPTLLAGFPLRAPRAVSLRSGESFWKVADRHGVAAAVVEVPYAFPPEPLEHGRVLSGGGVPDLRGSTAHFAYFTTAADAPADPAGGSVVRVAWMAERIESALPPLRIGARDSDPVALRLQRDGDRLRLELGDQRRVLAPGGWSDWIPVRFRISPLFSAAGICRVFVAEVRPELRLYVSAIGYDPREPWVPISAPEAFSATLAKSLGLFDTVGWAAPTAGLDAGVLDEVAFLADVDSDLRFARGVLLREIDQRDAALVVGGFTHIDRIAHMFYRFTDPASPTYDPAAAARYGEVIDRAYDAMDAIVADVQSHLPASTELIVVSDHGFHAFRRAVNLDTWLESVGLMKRATAGGDGFAGVDWSETRAYALGIGEIYLNLRGREARGSVAPGEDAEALLRRIAAGLGELRDPASGEAPIAGVLRGAQAFAGPFVDRAPDLLAVFRPGYRSSFATARGASPAGIVVDNDHRWSGDHSGSAASETPGIAITSFPIAAEAEPRLVDVAPTVLSRLGVPVPPGLAGRPLR